MESEQSGLSNQLERFGQRVKIGQINIGCLDVTDWFHTGNIWNTGK
jgi:hypothetical protein